MVETPIIFSEYICDTNEDYRTKGTPRSGRLYRTVTSPFFSTLDQQASTAVTYSSSVLFRFGVGTL